MNTAHTVARYLRDQGVKRAFGVPGGELVELIEAFRRVDIPFIMTHHEAPAAFMAGVTGELSGAPGGVPGYARTRGGQPVRRSGDRLRRSAAVDRVHW